VSFIDVSQPAAKQKGEAPIFIAKLPNDFFYPFLYYTNSATVYSGGWVLLTLSCVTTLYIGMSGGIL